MALVIGAVMALLAVMVAAYPFWRRRSTGLADDGQSEDEVERPSQEPGSGPEGLDAIYEAIRTLQLERELGNIPEGLYREQLDLYRLQAARLMRAYEMSQSGDLEWALEEEIKVARAGLRRPDAPPQDFFPENGS